MSKGLTDAQISSAIRRAKTDGEVIVMRDTGRTRGLQLVIQASGTATWSLLYTPRGGTTRKRLLLGRHEGRYGIVQARLDAGEHIAEIKRGGDPIVAREIEAAKARDEAHQRKTKAEALARRITVARLCELYFAHRDGQPGMEKAKRIVDHDVVPVIGTSIVEELRKRDLQRVVDEVVARGAATQARRVLEAFRPALRWAIDREYLAEGRESIWRGLQLPAKGEARERAITASEIAWLWKQCDAWADAEPNIARIVRLELLLGQRASEVCGMERTELSADRRTWTIPKERTKNGRDHVLPLPPLARSIIEEALEAADEAQEQLFVGGRGKVARADTVAHRLADAIRDAKAEPFVQHDLRRTLATRLEEVGVAMTTISEILNHVSAKAGSVTRKHYAHGDKTLPMRLALAKWQGVIERCIEGHDPFAVDVEDLDAAEARALAEVKGGASLRLVM